VESCRFVHLSRLVGAEVRRFVDAMPPIRSSPRYVGHGSAREGAGRAFAKVCEEPGSPFTLTGCEKPCTLDAANMTGYSIFSWSGPSRPLYLVENGAVFFERGAKFGGTSQTPSDPRTLARRVVKVRVKMKFSPLNRRYVVDTDQECFHLGRTHFCVKASCDYGAGFVGEAFTTVCDEPGLPVRLEGCTMPLPPCTVPPVWMLPGYTIASPPSEWDLDMESFDVGNVTCSEGYFPAPGIATPSAEACPGAGTDFSVYGCEKPCTVPTSQTGFNLTGNARVQVTVQANCTHFGLPWPTSSNGTDGQWCSITKPANEWMQYDSSHVIDADVPFALYDSQDFYAWRLHRGGFDVWAECADGFGLTPEFTETGDSHAKACVSPGADFSLTGCELPCAGPDSTTGFTVLEEANLFRRGFSVDVACADGYYVAPRCWFSPDDADGCVNSDAPYASVCSGPNQRYSLHGCELPCAMPATHDGYIVGGIGTNPLDFFRNGFKVEVSCATGYSVDPGWEGLGPSATACERPGEPFKLFGCERPCQARPWSSYRGYDVTETNLFRNGFNVTAECAPGYQLDPAYEEVHVSVCERPSTEYELRGCERPCKAPEDTTGYTIAAETNLFRRDFDVSVECAPGYNAVTVQDAFGYPAVPPKCSHDGTKATRCHPEVWGNMVTLEGAGAVRCSSAGHEYTLRGCERPCKRPSPKFTMGYNITAELNLLHNEFHVILECADGYYLQRNYEYPYALPCTRVDYYDQYDGYFLKGCEPGCKRPADTTGYSILAEASLAPARLNVTVECAEGYYPIPGETARAEACYPAGSEYLLRGCELPCTVPSGAAVVGYDISLNWLGHGYRRALAVHSEKVPAEELSSAAGREVPLESEFDTHSPVLAVRSIRATPVSPSSRWLLLGGESAPKLLGGESAPKLLGGESAPGERPFSPAFAPEIRARGSAHERSRLLAASSGVAEQGDATVGGEEPAVVPQDDRTTADENRLLEAIVVVEQNDATVAGEVADMVAPDVSGPVDENRLLEASVGVEQGRASVNREVAPFFPAIRGNPADTDRFLEAIVREQDGRNVAEEVVGAVFPDIPAFVDNTRALSASGTCKNAPISVQGYLHDLAPRPPLGPGWLLWCGHSKNLNRANFYYPCWMCAPGYAVAPGYTGAVAEVCDAPDTEFKLAGCELPCTAPPSQTGYVSVVETNLYRKDFDVVAACDTGSGYALAPNFTKATPVCAEPDTPYTLTGCELPCTASPSQPGYTNVVATNLHRKDFDVVAECDWGYDVAPGLTDHPLVEACAAPSTPYTFTGCELPCVAPGTAGYNTFDFQPFRKNFLVNVMCEAPDYDVSPGFAHPIAGACGEANTTYNVSGCELRCTNPGTTGYKPTETHPFRKDFDVGVVCASGYYVVPSLTSPEAKVCVDAGEPYSVSGCELPCAAPSTTTGYIVSMQAPLDSLFRKIFKVSVTCASDSSDCAGWSDSPNWTGWSDSSDSPTAPPRRNLTTSQPVSAHNIHKPATQIAPAIFLEVLAYRLGKE